MLFRLALICWLLGGVVSSGLAENGLRCDICGRPLRGWSGKLDDLVTGEKKDICQDCWQLSGRCSVCNLPVKPDCKKLPDGRLLCDRDARAAIDSEVEVRRICSGVVDDLNRLFSRFLTIPSDDVVISMLDKPHLENLLRLPTHNKACGSILGATQTIPLASGKYMHSINLLSDLPQARLMAVCAHEYTHVWLGENMKGRRHSTIAPDAVEGFCELVAYKYMASRQENSEMRTIKLNQYTRGQIDILAEADARYGFNAVMEWMILGEDPKLQMATLDRVRVIQDDAAIPPTVAQPALVAAVALPVAPPGTPAAGPDSLMLKGISGAGQHRFALINDGTFAAMEKGKVQLGQTHVLLRCLEIRDDSVLIQLDGSAEKKELFLRPRE